MGTLVVCKQLILQSPAQPPAFTLDATSPSLCCLFPCANVYHVLFVRSKEKRVEPCCCALMCARPSGASQDPLDLVVPQSIRAFPVSKTPLANMLVSVCTTIANSLYAVCECVCVCAVISPVFSAGFPCLSGHCEAQCRCRASAPDSCWADRTAREHPSVFCLLWPRMPELLLPVPWPMRPHPPL